MKKSGKGEFLAPFLFLYLRNALPAKTVPLWENPTFGNQFQQWLIPDLQYV
jgi:hypothetical protein